jgi:hypothetical protein
VRQFEIRDVVGVSNRTAKRHPRLDVFDLKRIVQVFGLFADVAAITVAQSDLSDNCG